MSLLGPDAYPLVFYYLSSEVKNQCPSQSDGFIGFMQWISLKMNITKLGKFLVYFQGEKKNVHKYQFGN